LRSDSALFVLNSANERAYSPAATDSMTLWSLGSKLSHTPLLMPTEKPEPGS
jgi:hypothetical protein